MKFLMYGAGSIGRGFIGPLFARAGYSVVFVDINTAVVEAMNRRRQYHYTVAATPPYDLSVEGVSCIDGRERAAVVEEIAGCELMATSLGAAALQKLAPIIAEGFALRMKNDAGPLNLIICENLKDSSHILRGWLAEALDQDTRALLNTHCGLIEAAIGRMIPQASANAADPLHITVEEYGFLPVDSAAFVGPPPQVEGLVPFSPFAFYEERKLYLHNMSHAICAYLGQRAGYEMIWEAVGDLNVRFFVQGAMVESAAMLSAKHSQPFQVVFDHADDLLMRFANAALGDICERVGRDPMRKLAAGDRLAGAMSECKKHSILPVFVALGYAAALRTLTREPAEAAKIARETGCLSEDLIALVMEMSACLELPTAELLAKIDGLKKSHRGNTF